MYILFPFLCVCVCARLSYPITIYIVLEWNPPPTRRKHLSNSACRTLELYRKRSDAFARLSVIDCIIEIWNSIWRTPLLPPPPPTRHPINSYTNRTKSQKCIRKCCRARIVKICFLIWFFWYHTHTLWQRNLVWFCWLIELFAVSVTLSLSLSLWAKKVGEKRLKLTSWQKAAWATLYKIYSYHNLPLYHIIEF